MTVKEAIAAMEKLEGNRIFCDEWGNEITVLGINPLGNKAYALHIDYEDDDKE